MLQGWIIFFSHIWNVISKAQAQNNRFVGLTDFSWAPGHIANFQLSMNGQHDALLFVPLCLCLMSSTNV